MDKKYKNTIAPGLLGFLKVNTKKYIESKGISPEHYLLYIYFREIQKGQKVAKVGTLILTLIFGVPVYFLAFVEGGEVEELSMIFRWFMVLLFAGIGFLIGFLATRQMRGKGSKNIDIPGPGSSGDFVLIGVGYRTSLKYVKKLKDKHWERIRNFEPDLEDSIYQEVAGMPKSEKEKEKLMKMTPEKEAKVKRIAKMERFFWWMILPGLILFPFFEDPISMTLLMFAWLMIGMALSTLCYKGFVEGNFGAFVAANTVEFYGWPAKAMALFVMGIAILIFVLPGLAGILEGFGFNLIDWIYNLLLSV
ncbi:hypothetical protein HOG48_06445 [Candidatus Peregrinibacteria bacterium]|jgi:hypothetical protein|nr:hypothetical protein [Candidatus Peregrinibacteria bacterium]